MQKFSFLVRAVALCAAFAVVAGTAVQAQDEGGRRQRGQRGEQGGRPQRGGFGGFGGFGGQRGGFPGGGLRTTSKAELLGMEEVQKELKLDGDQLETVKAAVDSYRQERRDMRGNGGFDRESFAKLRELEGEEREKAMAELREKAEKAAKEAAEKTSKLDKETDEILAALLDEPQWKRLNQIQVQSTLRSGMLPALLDKEFAAKLKITKDQSEKLQAIKEKQDKTQQEMMAKMRESFQGGGGGGFDRSAFDDIRKKREEMTKEAEAQATALLTDAQKKQLEEMQGAKFAFPERQRGGFGGGRGGAGGGRPQRPGGGRPQRPGGGAERP